MFDCSLSGRQIIYFGAQILNQFGLLLRVEEHRTRHQNGMGKRETLSLIYDKCKQPGSRKGDKRMH